MAHPAMARPSPAYLDTNVTVWVAEGKLTKITAAAKRILESADLLISPMVLIELQYLYELKRIKVPARDILLKIQHEIGVQVCGIPFPVVANVMLDENWTRDPFDRMIVSQAKANGLAMLVSSDGDIADHYQRTIW